MEIIFITKAGGGRRRIHLGRWASLSLLAGLGLLAGGAVVLSHLWIDAPEDLRPQLYAAAWVNELQVQRREVSGAIRRAEDNVDALALRLGDLQARMIRLDALGQRLVEMADLDAAEFRFHEPPPVGGPRESKGAKRYTIDDFLGSLEELLAQIEDRTPKLTTIEGLLMNSKLEAEVSPAGRPVQTGWISSNFGWRTDPISGKRSFHEGVDFAGRRNSAVVVVASGVVVWSGNRSGYGKVVEVNHGNGYATRYAHNQKNLVKVGDTVKKGQTIALLGSTGESTGPHVHFEVLHKGRPIDPMKFVRASR